ncbi:MAG: class I tRNA ligase family protein [Planctomycetota bacterium]
MLEHNAGITWFPEHIREGRFGNFLRDNIDWALSRERYWGTPLPLWKCEACSWKEAASSLADLRAKPGAAGFDRFEKAKAADAEIPDDLAIHKPYIDAVTFACPKCSSVMRRTPEVIDCWFDSGAMPFAQWGYPHVDGSKEKLAAALPADFISEAIDQTRGWFYSLLAISTMLPKELGFGLAPYRNCVVLGLVCDEKGFKMSKSKGNYVEPAEMLDKQGADAMRWYFLSANQPWTSVRFSGRNVAMANKDFLIKLRNVHQFFLIYARIDEFDPAAAGPPVANARASEWGERGGRRPVTERAPLDRWILSELALTVKAVRAGLESYDAYGAAQALSTFVESLSNWYLRRSRPRYWGAGKGAEMPADKSDAYWTLYESLVTASLLAAPFTPFAAEGLYQTLVRSAWPDTAPESVHLAEFPREGDFPEDARLSRAMALAREAAALGRAARAEAKIKVRQPLAEAAVVAPDAADAELLEEMSGVWAEELNVKRGHVERSDPPHVKFSVKPNFKSLGPRLGKKVKDLAKLLAKADGRAVREALRDGGSYEVDLVGEKVSLSAEDLDVRVEATAGHAAAAGANVLVVLDTEVSPELEAEGLARELVSIIQGFRKELDLPYEARISLWVVVPEELGAKINPHRRYIMQETLAGSFMAHCRDVVERNLAEVKADPARKRAMVGEYEVEVLIQP